MTVTKIFFKDIRSQSYMVLILVFSVMAVNNILMVFYFKNQFYLKSKKIEYFQWVNNKKLLLKMKRTKMNLVNKILESNYNNNNNNVSNHISQNRLFKSISLQNLSFN